jgi:hypothetical protein
MFILIKARLDTFDHGLSHPFESLGAVADGLTGQKCVGEVRRQFLLQLNAVGF